MASKKTFVQIYNRMRNGITLDISEIDNFDWDGVSRPDHNLKGRVIEAGSVIKEREEINLWARTCWYRLQIVLPNGYTFSQRIDQRTALQRKYFGKYQYIVHNHKYATSLRADGECLHISLADDTAVLPKTITEFSAGAFKTDILGKFLQHTYVFTNTHNFQCWGGVNREEVKLVEKGDEELAIAIACFDPYDNRPDYNKHVGEIKIFCNWYGDCSGIVYGVTGVCHQMTNRILYACDNHPEVFDFTPSARLSYLAYGVYGHHIITDTSNWLQYIGECERMVAEARATSEEEMRTLETILTKTVPSKLLNETNALSDFSKQAIALEINHLNDDDLPNRRLHLLIDTYISETFDEHKKAILFAKNAKFHEQKNTMVKDFLVDEEQPKTKEDLLKFADKINIKHRELLKEFKQVLTEEEFYKLCGVSYHEQFELVNKELIQ